MSEIYPLTKHDKYESEVDRSTGELRLFAWDRETSIGFKLPISPTDSNIISDKVELNYQELSIKLFEVPKTETWEFGGIDYEIILPVKPPSNSYAFQISMKGLKAYYPGK